jgi:peptidoglycan/LPS O-acetylase OafA/YrhL
VRTFRVDVQALRGLAVLLVVLYHARVPGLVAGYLGVDVFFVISGFLITGLIRRQLERGHFRFSDFYFRRAKRLLPAAYVTFLTTLVIAPFLLDGIVLRDFGLQMIGALTFTGNVVLWQQTGYFEGASALKPLLHVWSLAVEEQYYLILPALLVFTAPRHWLPGAVVISAGSLAVCIVGGYQSPSATFYLLPARAWELALGSVGALIAPRSGLHRLAGLLFVPAVLALLAIPFFPLRAVHPALNTVAVCVSTLIVILRDHPVLNATMPARLLAKVGDFSYSLYLVHWPIFAFPRNAWVGLEPALPGIVRLACVLVSMVSGYLLYRGVEAPVRRADLRLSRSLLVRAAAVTVLLLVTTVTIVTMRNTANLSEMRRMNQGFGSACDHQSGRMTPDRRCRNSDTPSILVWGDSMAMHLIPGLVATSGASGVVQATRSSCGPMLGVAWFGGGSQPGADGSDPRHPVRNRAEAERCIEFNASVLDYLTTAPSVDVVILSGLIELEVAPANHLLQETGGHGDTAAGPDPVIAGLQRTVRAVRALGKRVVFVAPPPAADFNIGSCLERSLTGRLVFGAAPDCAVPIEAYQRRRSSVRSLLARLPEEVDLAVFSFEALLCGNTSCRTSMDATFLYRDDMHFSHDGSRAVAELVSLARTLTQMAR